MNSLRSIFLDFGARKLRSSVLPIAALDCLKYLNVFKPLRFFKCKPSISPFSPLASLLWFTVLSVFRPVRSVRAPSVPPLACSCRCPLGSVFRGFARFSGSLALRRWFVAVQSCSFLCLGRFPRLAAFLRLFWPLRGLSPLPALRRCAAPRSFLRRAARCLRFARCRWLLAPFRVVRCRWRCRSFQPRLFLRCLPGLCPLVAASALLAGVARSLARRCRLALRVWFASGCWSAARRWLSCSPCLGRGSRLRGLRPLFLCDRRFGEQPLELTAIASGRCRVAALLADAIT